jgi:hypothetical protein
MKSGPGARAGRALLLLLLIATTTSSTTPSPSPSPPLHHRYLVVGAGPGGLQAAHYLSSAGRDYLVLDSASEAGSFFSTYPRWRQLISINKVETGREEADFNMRHDWNSLLSEPSHSSEDGLAESDEVPCPLSLLPSSSSSSSPPPCRASSYSSSDARWRTAGVNSSLLFRSRTRTYYPEADRLRDFLGDWARLPGASASASAAPIAGLGRSEPLRIRFGSTVVRVDRPEGYEEPASRDEELRQIAEGRPRFVVEVAGAQTTTFTCMYLLWAGGLQELNPPLGANIDEAISRGWVQTYASASTNLTFYTGKRVLLLGRGNAAFEFANSVLEVAASVHLLGRSSGRVKLAWETHYPGDVRSVHNHLLETYLLKSMDGMAEVALEHLRFRPAGDAEGEGSGEGGVDVSDDYTPCLRDEYGRATQRCFFRRRYDVVIACSGWRFARGPFAERVRPALHTNNKHPALTARYESPGVPGLFFAGNLMHAHDFKKSSGGFIHGFRYLVRALHRILEEEELEAAAGAGGARHELAVTAPGEVAAVATAGRGGGQQQPSAWPRRTLRSLRQVVAAILRRLNVASGPYQMFGGLVDVLLLRPLCAGAAAAGTGAGANGSTFPFDSVLAALEEPWSFFDEEAERNAARDPTGLFADVAALQMRPKQKRLLPPTTAAAEAALSAALLSDVFEEVPVRLVHDKVRAWHAQRCAAEGARPGGCAVGCGEDGGPEWVTVSLEFSEPPKTSVAPASSPADPNEVPAALRARGEWSHDPFSRLRANVGLHNPEKSHFLHPVIRFYHGGLVGGEGGEGSAAGPAAVPNATATLHIIEDFHTVWDHHVAHILPLARFLQDIAARRLAASAAAGIPSSPVTPPTLLRALWDVPRPPSTHASIVDRLLSSPAATLYYRGARVHGREGWVHSLSVAAADALLHSGPPVVAAHFLDTALLPVSREEAAHTERLRAEMERRAGGLGLFMARTTPPLAAPSAPTSGAGERQTALRAHLDGLYRNLTAANPGLPVVLFDYRAGESRLRAEEFGAGDAPVVRVFGGSAVAGRKGVVKDLDGTDLVGLPAALESLWKAHLQARGGGEEGGAKPTAAPKRPTQQQEGGKPRNEFRRRG